LLSIFSEVANAQLVVRAEKNFTKMVRQSFVGPGVQIRNVIFRGDSAAIGIFDGRNSNIGLDSGIIITTGKAVDAIGPDNIDASTAQDASGTGGKTDGDLNSLLNGSSTKDATSIQFTFTPSANRATFNVVFASEEYAEFVGKPYNDIFGFFLSGPGITGKKNLALVPGTQEPISVNTINQITNANLFVNNIGGLTIQYNGFTKVLQIVADNLIPCEDYILKLVIADVQDAIYDSGIFLASMNSESPNDNFITRNTPAKSKSYIQEKCDSAIFRFTRSSNLNQAGQTVKYKVGGTATRGVDYIDIPDSITIEPGKLFADLVIFPVDDNITENAESVVIEVSNNTICAVSIDSINIQDFDTLKITTYVDVRCQGDTIFKQVKFVGGSTRLSYLWTDSLGNIKGASSILEASPDSLTMYIISIYDSCINFTTVDTIYIPPITIVNLVAPNDTIVCAPVDLVFNLQSNIPDLKYSWTAQDPGNNSVGLFNNDTIQKPIYTVPSGVFEITVKVKVDRDNYCSDEKTFKIRVIPKGVFGAKTIYVCNGDSTLLRAYGGGTYKWSPSDGIVGDTSAANVVVYKPGTYKASVTDTINCLKEFTVNVVYDTVPKALAGKDIVICERSSIQLDAQGSQYNTYEWSPATGLTNSKIGNPIASPLVTTTYVLKSKNNACFSFDTMTIFVITKPETDFAYEFDSCAKVISFSNTTLGTDSFYWDFGDSEYSLERNPMHKYDTTGTLTVSLIANRGTDCTDTSTININLIDVEPDKRIVPNTFTPNGDNKNDVFKVSGGNVGCAITKMSIYNRWGKLLHEIKDVEVWEWDGRIGSEIVPPGVYFYSIIGEGFEDVGMVNVIY
jgi:gliding motility-associated-like protein